MSISLFLLIFHGGGTPIPLTLADPTSAVAALTPDKTSSPIAQTPSISVAVILSTTGIASPHNKPLIPLIQLAVDEINSHDGLLGRQMDVLILDNQSTPIGSAKAAKEAIENNVLAVIGAHWSSHSLVMAPILQQAETPMITVSTNPEIALVGDYIFQVSLTDAFQGKILAKFAREGLNSRRAVVVKNISEAYSRTLADYFSHYYGFLGGEILLETAYKGNAVDFQDIIAQIKSVSPEIVFIPGYSRDSGLFINQSVMQKLDAVFLGADAWDDIARYAGETLDGSYRSAMWHPDIQNPRSSRLQKEHNRRYGSTPINYSAVPWYDAFMLLKDAVGRADTLDRSKLRDALAATENFQGATGVLSFDENGEVVPDTMVILKYEKGRETFFEAVTP